MMTPKKETSRNPKNRPTIIRNMAKTNRFLFNGNSAGAAPPYKD
jgi:hypothetical protein